VLGLEGELDLDKVTQCSSIPHALALCPCPCPPYARHALGRPSDEAGNPEKRPIQDQGYCRSLEPFAAKLDVVKVLTRELVEA
jgi:hypothetical protein